MDTTDQYIKMCEMAEEIQEEWKPRLGDLMYAPSFCRYLFGRLENVSVEKDTQWILKPNEIEEINRNELLANHCFWLPRQEQLQEMVKEKSDVYPWTLNRRFWKWSHGFYEHEIAGYYNSFEKLWLAFVMSQKHGKRWDGEKWIKEE